MSKQVASLTTFFFIISMAIAGSRFFGEFGLYPILNLIYTSGIVLIIVISWTDERLPDTFWFYVGIITAIAVAYRTHIFLYPESMIGMDPDNYAIQTVRVLDGGGADAITWDFYTHAPSHIFIGAIGTLITALPIRTSSVIYPIIGGIIPPLIAAVMVRRLRPQGYHTAIVAAGAVALSAYIVRFSFWPVAQLTGVLLLSVGILAFFCYFSQRERAWLAITILAVTGTIFTHKLSTLAFAFSLTGAAILLMIHPRVDWRPVFNRTYVIVALVSCLTVVQFFYVTDFANYIVYGELMRLLDSSYESLPIPSAASDPYDTGVRIFRLSHLLLTAVLAGTVWLTWIWHTLRDSSHTSDVLFLGLVAPLAGLFVVLFPAGFHPGRAIFYSSLFLTVLVVVGIYWFFAESSHNMPAYRRIAATVIVLMFIVVAGLSPLAAADYDPLSRYYLTAEEVDAKEWGIEMVSENVTTDQYYVHETPPQHISPSASFETEGFEDGTIMFLNNSIHKDRPPTIAHRECVDILRSEIGVYQLEYDPEPVLRTGYNKPYDSGCVAYYSS